jgi:hypothetical protein
MSKANTLSAVDFLGLASRRLTKLVTVDTGAGEASFWVRELSQADKEKLTGSASGRSAKYRRKDDTIELSLSPTDAAKLMRYAVVTDQAGQVTVYDELVKGGMSGAEVMAKFQSFPAAIVEEISRVVSELSGLADTEAETLEKKE